MIAAALEFSIASSVLPGLAIKGRTRLRTAGCAIHSNGRSQVQYYCQIGAGNLLAMFYGDYPMIRSMQNEDPINCRDMNGCWSADPECMFCWIRVDV